MTEKRKAMEGPTGSTTGGQVKLSLSAADEENLYVRSRRDGSARISVDATAVVAESWRVRGAAPAHQYAALVEDLTEGTYLMTPTTEDDEDKMVLHWRKGGKEITLSLRRFLKLRRFQIDKGTALVIPCRRGKTEDGKLALELVLPEARQVPSLQRRTAPGHAAPAADGMKQGE